MLSFQSIESDYYRLAEHESVPFTTFALRSGERVFARTILRQDSEAIKSIYAGLSPGSTYLRFNTNLCSTAPCFTSQIHQQIAEQIVENGFGMLVFSQSVLGNRRCYPIGTGYYIKSEGDVARLDLTVTDAWQCKGLGRKLLMKLAQHARSASCSRLEVHVNNYNEPMKALLAKLDRPILAIPLDTVTKYQILID